MKDLEATASRTLFPWSWSLLVNLAWVLLISITNKDQDHGNKVLDAVAMMKDLEASKITSAECVLPLNASTSLVSDIIQPAIVILHQRVKLGRKLTECWMNQ